MVTPCSRCFWAFLAAFSAASAGVSSAASAAKSGPPSNCRCTWQSINPGVRVIPVPSTGLAASAVRGARVWAPTHSIAPSRTCTPCFVLTVLPSNSVTFEM